MDKILENLPEYCSRFLYHQLNGAKKLQPRTTLAYAGDLNLFFYFLAIANPACKDIPAKDVSADILAKLSVDDIEEYYEWLADYERDGKTYTNFGMLPGSFLVMCHLSYEISVQCTISYGNGTLLLRIEIYLIPTPFYYEFFRVWRQQNNDHSTQILCYNKY